MEIVLTKLESELLTQSLMDTIVNSENFGEVEKSYLEEIYHKVKEQQGK